MNTDPEQFINELGGGVFAEKLGAILSMVSAGCIDNKKPGEITIKLKIKPVGEQYINNVSHTLSYTRPTMRGKSSEEETGETQMHVGRGGRMTLFPEDQAPRGQQHLLKGAKGEPMGSE